MDLCTYCSTIYVILASVIFLGIESQSCTKINSCSCTYGSNQVVDLSPLSGSPKTKTTLFKLGGTSSINIRLRYEMWWPDVYDPNYLSMYSYNPCKAFSEGTCNNVAVCQFNGADYYECGTQESATFTNDPTSGALVVTYSSTDSAGTTRTSEVTLTCDQSGADTLVVSGESTTGLYIFELKSSHCCPKSGPSPSGGGGDSSGLSIGSILVIVFFALIIVYFVAGATFLKFGRNAEGADVVPNRGFWGALPGLVKDGTLFVFRRGKGSYNEI